MKLKRILPLLLILCIAFFLFSGCYGLLGEQVIPEIEIHNSFENESYLIIDSTLINKKTGEVLPLDYNEDAAIPEIDNIYRPGAYSYQYFFNDTEIEEHTYIESYDHEPKTLKRIEQLHPCIITYDYTGKETGRTYTGDPIEKEAFGGPFNEAFSISNDYLFYETEYHSKAQKAIMNLAESYSEASITGIAKPMGDVYWFSIAISDEGHYNSGFGLFYGIDSSRIFSYDPSTDQFKELFKYNKKGAAIIDFDKNGFYTLDAKRRLNYYDFETKKPEKIHTFSDTVVGIDITEDHIAVMYEYDTLKYGYFVYEKSGNILTDERYS